MHPAGGRSYTNSPLQFQTSKGVSTTEHTVPMKIVVSALWPANQRVSDRRGVSCPPINPRRLNMSASAKPAFRSSFRPRRCLILADGFYGWQARAGKKQPYYIRLKSGQPFGIAGLWDR